MKLWKILLPVTLCLVLVLVLLPTTAAAASSGTCGDNVTWTLDDVGTLTISGTGPMKVYISYSSVPWFSNRSSVKKVVIADGVTTIGDEAFFGCYRLTSVTIPDSVTAIGASAFSGCDSLTYNTYDTGKYLGNAGNPYLALVDTTSDSITQCTIHPNTKIIASGAFRSCTSLTGVMIPDGVTTIGYEAFYDCNSLTSVTIPDSVTTIGEGAFENCDSLSYSTYNTEKYLGNAGNSHLALVDTTSDSITQCIILPNTKIIAGSAFSDCYRLTGVTIPDSVTTIGDYAFFGCESLTGVTIPDSVTTIGASAFSHCDSLKSVTIPDSVATIGRSAFSGCDSLTSVTIPDSVTAIGGGTFRSCNSLTGIWVDADNPNYSSDSNGVLFNKDKTILVEAPGTIVSYTIPDSVTTIGEEAFSDCYSLTAVTIPDSVTTIGDDAFSWCASLTDVYYYGTQAQWDAISVGSYNAKLLNATIHFVTQGVPRDVDGNEELDTDDAVYLLLHVMFGDRYTRLLKIWKWILKAMDRWIRMMHCICCCT